MTGNAAANILDGGLGDDTLIGGAGDDVLYSDGGNDMLDGGLGHDRYVFKDTWGVTTIANGLSEDIIEFADLSVNDVAKFTFGCGEWAIAAAQEVGITVDSNALLIIPRLNGAEVPAQMIVIKDWAPKKGGKVRIDGKDYALDLGTGDNDIFGAKGAAVLTSAGADFIRGFEGDDTIDGGGGSDIIQGGDGNDTIYYRGSESWLNGDDGSDTLSLAKLTAGAIVDLTASDTKFFNFEKIIGSNYSDKLTLADQQVGRLEGGAGDDVLIGSNYSQNQEGDRLTGGKGNDILIGGGGYDRYVYYQGDGKDTIKKTEANNGEDSIAFGQGISFDDLSFKQVNGDDLLIGIKDASFATSTITVEDWFTTGGAIGKFRFWDDAANDWLQNAAAGDTNDISGSVLQDAVNAKLSAVVANPANPYVYDLSQSINHMIIPADSGNNQDYLQIVVESPEQMYEYVQKTGASIPTGQISYDAKGNPTDMKITFDANHSLELKQFWSNPTARVKGFEFVIPGIDVKFTYKLAMGSGNITGTDANEFVLGFDGDTAQVIHGGGGNDIISAGDGPDTVYGDAGNDIILCEMGGKVNGQMVGQTVSGGAGADRYIINLGDGSNKGYDGCFSNTTLLYDAVNLNSNDIVDIRLYDLQGWNTVGVNRSPVDRIVITGTGDDLVLSVYKYKNEDAAVNIGEVGGHDFWAYSDQRSLDFLTIKNGAKSADACPVINIDSKNYEIVKNGDKYSLNEVTGTTNPPVAPVPLQPVADMYTYTVGSGSQWIAGNAENHEGTLKIVLDPLNLLAKNPAGFQPAASMQGDDLQLSFVPGESLVLQDWLKGGDYQINHFQVASNSGPDISLSWDLKASSANGGTVLGTASNEMIVGMNQDDVLYGYGGNDILAGGEGFDVLYGGAGDDILIYDNGFGNDKLYGEDGCDFLSCMAGDGVLAGGAGADTYFVQVNSECLARISQNPSAYMGTEIVADASNASDTLVIRGISSIGTLSLTESDTGVTIGLSDLNLVKVDKTAEGVLYMPHVKLGDNLSTSYTIDLSTGTPTWKQLA